MTKEVFMKKGLFLICCFFLFLAGCSDDKEEINAELELKTDRCWDFRDLQLL